MKRYSERLNELTIRGFKSIPFHHPLTLSLGDITILLGANGAGKSNIISFFKMLGFMMSGRLQQYFAQFGASHNFFHYGPKTTSSIAASLLITSDKATEEYTFSLTHALPDRIVLISEDIERKTESEEKKETLNSDFRESALTRAVSKQNKKIQELLSNCKVYQFSDSSLTAPMRQPSPVDSAHYLQSEGNNLASFLYFLKNNYQQEFCRITEYVRDIIPQFQDFYLEPERGYISLKWIDKSPNDYILSADQLSDGSIRFIALTTLLLQPPETIPFVIIIDEPELGLHPYAIDQLNEMIKDASIHAQVIVATQSTAILDGFNTDEITVIERDEKIRGTVARRLNEEEYKDWLDEYTLSELWNKNVIGGRPV